MYKETIVTELTKEKLELVELLNNPPKKCITLWYRVDKDKLVYNHFEYGVETFLNWKITFPKPINENFNLQKNWKNIKWFKTTGTLEVKTNKIIDEFYFDENQNTKCYSEISSVLGTERYIINKEN